MKGPEQERKRRETDDAPGVWLESVPSDARVPVETPRFGWRLPAGAAMGDRVLLVRLTETGGGTAVPLGIYRLADGSRFEKSVDAQLERLVEFGSDMHGWPQTGYELRELAALAEFRDARKAGALERLLDVLREMFPDQAHQVQAALFEPAPELELQPNGSNGGEASDVEVPKSPSPLDRTAPSLQKAATPAPKTVPAPPSTARPEGVAPVLGTVSLPPTIAVVAAASPAASHTVEVFISETGVVLRRGHNTFTSRYALNATDWASAQGAPERMGEVLFDAIFNELAMGAPERTTLHGLDLATIDTGATLRLHLFPIGPKQEALPWELLVDSRSHEPLALRERAPLARRLPAADELVPVAARPLRVAVAIANPTTLESSANPFLRPLAKLDVLQERDIVESSLNRLRDAGAVEIDMVEPPVTLQRVLERLEEGAHVLHLVAHGLQIDHLPYLVLENEGGADDFVDAKALGKLGNAGNLRLLVLASCRSADPAAGLTLGGLAPELVSRDIPAVAAMRGSVEVALAQRFTARFYDDLSRTGEVDRAMAAARMALHTAAPRSFDWSVPVLFLGSPEAKLFEPGDDAPRQPLELPPAKSYHQLRGLGDPRPRIAAGSPLAGAELQVALLEALRGLGERRPPTGPGSYDEAPPGERRPALRDLKRPLALDAAALRDHVEKDTHMKLPNTLFEQTAAALSIGKHVIFIGPPGTGKTTLANAVCAFAEAAGYSTGTTHVTATADWTTFDTVGGYVPTEGQTLAFRPGSVLRALGAGEWLVLDEINRAEIDKAFGELFTLLAGHPVDLPYRVGGSTVRILPPGPSDDWLAPARTPHDYVMHPSWRILATMNVYDRAYLFRMSFAFMRRFSFIEVGLPPRAGGGQPDRYAALVRDWIDARVHAGDAALDLAPFRERLGEGLNALLDPGSQLMKRRALGPAIVKDIVDYVARRSSAGDPGPSALHEAVELYVVPQLDGLDQTSIFAIYKELARNLAIGERAPVLERVRQLYPHILEDWPEVGPGESGGNGD